MNNLTDDQRAAIDRLQAQQSSATAADRRQFMGAIASVPRAELETTPQPPKEKRGPKPKSEKGAQLI